MSHSHTSMTTPFPLNHTHYHTHSQLMQPLLQHTSWSIMTTPPPLNHTLNTHSQLCSCSPSPAYDLEYHDHTPHLNHTHSQLCRPSPAYVLEYHDHTPSTKPHPLTAMQPYPALRGFRDWILAEAESEKNAVP